MSSFHLSSLKKYLLEISKIRYLSKLKLEQNITPSSLSKQGGKIVDTFIKNQIKEPDSFNSTISEKDDMYFYLLDVGFNGNKDCAFLQYLNSGKQMMDAVRQIITWGFGSLENISSFLDFACGYGRSMRFLIQEFPAEKIWASEINEDAVKFQVEQFKVNTIVSVIIPEEYQDKNKYDCIFVGSLFSHLPKRTFIGWLKGLYNMLTPDGLLIFTVHDVDVMPQNLRMSQDGILFIHESENQSLDKNDYGATYVTESFVKKIIAGISGRENSYCRIIKGLWSFQDLYVITRNYKRDFSTLELSIGLNGYLDKCTLMENGDVFLSGWAADFTKNASGIKDVQIIINDQIVKHCLPSYERPDVANHFRDSRGYLSGWSCNLESGTFKLSDYVIVKIISKNNTELIPGLGTLALMLK